MGVRGCRDLGNDKIAQSVQLDRLGNLSPRFGRGFAALRRDWDGVAIPRTGTRKDLLFRSRRARAAAGPHGLSTRAITRSTEASSEGATLQRSDVVQNHPCHRGKLGGGSPRKRGLVGRQDGDGIDEDYD